MCSEFKHFPVMKNETVEALNLSPDSVCVDCTCGGGGHSAAILALLGEGGLLISIDRDEDALAAAEHKLKSIGGGAKYKLVQDNFRNLGNILDKMHINGVNAIIADLGVSSYQLDSPGRGFSFRNRGPLDMRMDRREKNTAAELVNTADEEELTRIFRCYGEERYASSIAGAILKRRGEKSIEDTGELSQLIISSVPPAARRGRNPAFRVFQALRISVNDELSSLEDLLLQVPDLLKSGGRFAAISFHSLEDRLVKNSMRSWEKPCTCPPGLPCVCGKKSAGKILFRGGITASEKELLQNPRSRSARLRVFEKY